MTVLDEIRNTAVGGQMLSDWLGHGGDPVLHSLAQSRAFICEFCPNNVEPKWWDRVKDGIARTIRNQLELKRSLNLELRNEETLGVCRCCGCCLPLKVWVPTDYVRRHTSASQLDKMPNECWIKREIA